MEHIPGAKDVERSLRHASNQVRSAVRQINEYAGKLVAKGDYGAAEELIPKAREVQAFESEVENLYRRWLEIQGHQVREGESKEKSLPLWKYYAPMLRKIIELGGGAGREVIEKQMETVIPELGGSHGNTSTPLPLGWRMVVRRALKAMEKEGFLSKERKEWRITASGRKAAEAK